MEARLVNEALRQKARRRAAGLSDGEDACCADWETKDDALKAVMPKAEMKRAFESGATHLIFWLPVSIDSPVLQPTSNDGKPSLTGRLATSLSAALHTFCQSACAPSRSVKQIRGAPILASGRACF